jgi:hypothetical protein
MAQMSLEGEGEVSGDIWEGENKVGMERGGREAGFMLTQVCHDPSF